MSIFGTSQVIMCISAYNKRGLSIAETSSLRTGNVLLSRAVTHRVSLALRSLTTVFEMGTGVTFVLLSRDFMKYVPSKLNNALNQNWSSARPISIGQLNQSPDLHLRPINVIVSHGS